MNTFSITLSSNTSSTSITTNEVYLTDLTTLYVNLTNISIENLPKDISISWGDGSIVETYSTKLTDFSILTGSSYSHIFYPSTDTLTKNISCQLTVSYIKSLASCTFTIPVTIIAPSYYNKINDLILLQSNIIDENNSILFTFGSISDGSIIETVLSPS